MRDEKVNDCLAFLEGITLVTESGPSEAHSSLGILCCPLIRQPSWFKLGTAMKFLESFDW